MSLTPTGGGAQPRPALVTGNAYRLGPWTADLVSGRKLTRRWTLGASRGWYDLSVRIEGDSRWRRRLADRIETGRDSITDPAMAGPAIMIRG